MDLLSVNSEIRAFIRQIENTLRNSNESSEFQDIFSDIENIAFVGREKALKTASFSNLSQAKSCLFHNFYMPYLKAVLNNVSSEIASFIPAQTVNRVLQTIFKSGNLKDCFLTLSWGLNEFRPSYKLNKCVSLLEDFLKSHLLCKIIVEQCAVLNLVEQNFTWEELITAVCSLPDRAANKLQSQNSEIFYPKQYITLVGSDIVTVLKEAHEEVAKTKDISLEFVSRLIGKLCITGYSDVLLDTLLDSLTPLVREDYIWCRICERVITGVPDRCLESVLLTLIQKLPWYGLMEKFIGDSVLKKQKLQYLLCSKVLLFRHKEQVHVLQNVLGYLGSSHTRKHLLIKSMKDLLSVWGDNSAIRHTSPEQHLYITKALFICLGFIGQADKEAHKEEFLRLIMPGVQAHIGNADYKIRQQGMVLAETLISVIDPNGPKLKFEYEKTKETESLLQLMEPPDDTGVDLQKLQKRVKSFQLDQIRLKEEEMKESETKNQAESQVDSDLDSDDDLVPYDMSSDVKVTKVKQPKYIRDCMEGLICNDDPERTEVCLKTAEALIRKEPDGLEEISDEFCKILLHLGDKYSTPGFTQLRFSSMVALAVCVPVQVSGYLTREFYDRNYNLRQRMDILEVLASAAQELSQPLQNTECKPQKKIVEIQEETWQSIVQRRIETKTRRFSKGRSKPEPQHSVNRFAPVAGHFFYPLMTRFDRKENTFDMLGEDSLVLGRLIYTLGVIIYSAINSPTIKQMGSSLLEFLWVLRFHQDQSVRHSILFCLSMVMLAVPGHILLTDLQSEILEAKQWLEDVVQRDPDTESKKLALQCLVLLENTIKQEFTGDEPT